MTKVITLLQAFRQGVDQGSSQHSRPDQRSAPVIARKHERRSKMQVMWRTNPRDK